MREAAEITQNELLFVKRSPSGAWIGQFQYPNSLHNIKDLMRSFKNKEMWSFDYRLYNFELQIIKTRNWRQKQS